MWTWEARAETSLLSLVPGLLSSPYWGERVVLSSALECVHSISPILSTTRVRAHAPHPQGVPIPSQSTGLGATACTWRLFWVRQGVANLVLDWVVACPPHQLSKPTPNLHPATSKSGIFNRLYPEDRSGVRKGLSGSDLWGHCPAAAQWNWVPAGRRFDSLWAGLGRRRLYLVAHKAFPPLSAGGYRISSTDAASS